MFDPIRAQQAIAAIESRGSGDYSALGPVTRKGDRAYGRYQVMGANIPSWTQSALGRQMTADEFLKDQAAQDAVFNHQFGNSVKKYGNVGDAASVWFTGRPLSQGGNAKDQLGTSGHEYVNKFMKAYDGSTGPGGATGAADLPVEGAQEAQGILSPGAIAGGPGVLSQEPQWSFGDALIGAGTAMMARDNPQGAAALRGLMGDKNANRTSAAQAQYLLGQQKLQQRAQEFQARQLQQQEDAARKAEQYREAPVPAIKLFSENNSALTHADTVMRDGDEIRKAIADGKLDVSLYNRWISSGKQLAGVSDEQAQYLSKLETFSKNATNLRLMEQKGVQTNADFMRAYEEFMPNFTKYDNKSMMNALGKLRDGARRQYEDTLATQEVLSKRYAGSFDPTQYIAPRRQALSGIEDSYNKSVRGGVDAYMAGTAPSQLKAQEEASGPAPSARTDRSGAGAERWVRGPDGRLQRAK